MPLWIASFLKRFGSFDLPDKNEERIDKIEENLNKLTEKQRENAARIRLLEIQANPRGRGPIK